MHNRKTITKGLREYLTDDCLTFIAHGDYDVYEMNSCEGTKEFKIKNLLDLISYCLDQEISKRELADCLLSNFDVCFNPSVVHNF